MVEKAEKEKKRGENIKSRLVQGTGANDRDKELRKLFNNLKKYFKVPKKEKKLEKKPKIKFEDLQYWEKRKLWNAPRGGLKHGGKAKKKYGVVGKPTLKKGGKV